MSIASEISRLQQAKANIKTSIENKGVVVPSATKLDGYSSLIDQISQGTTEAPFNDVNFYDYDGTRLYSYTKQEFLALNEMPANPTHAGLTSQGWNWTLADAKDYVGKCDGLNIGAMFVPTDNKTKIFIHLEDRLQPYCAFAINGTATINWGDGNSENVVGTSTSTLIYTQHTYAQGGDYVVSISSESDIYILGANSQCTLLTKQSATSNENYVYVNAINKVVLGTNAKIDANAFNTCFTLKSIIIPSGITSIGANSFANCSGLSYITFPSSLTTYGNNCFQQCIALENMSLPSEAVVGPQVFAYCKALRTFYFPTSTTNILSYVIRDCYALTKIKPYGQFILTGYPFHSCYGMKEYNFTNCTSVPTLPNTVLFTGIPSDCKIVVPDSLYNSWITASNWANYASYIIKESDYNA